jgi:tetratricopeptide (TPR) repeat protein
MNRTMTRLTLLALSLSSLVAAACPDGSQPASIETSLSFNGGYGVMYPGLPLLIKALLLPASSPAGTLTSALQLELRDASNRPVDISFSSGDSASPAAIDPVFPAVYSRWSLSPDQTANLTPGTYTLYMSGTASIAAGDIMFCSDVPVASSQIVIQPSKPDLSADDQATVLLLQTEYDARNDNTDAALDRLDNALGANPSDSRLLEAKADVLDNLGYSAEALFNYSLAVQSSGNGSEPNEVLLVKLGKAWSELINATVVPSSRKDKPVLSVAAH